VKIYNLIGAAALYLFSQVVFASGEPVFGWTGVEIRGFAAKCLDVRGPNGFAENTAVQVWGCGNRGNQRWDFYDDGTIRTSLRGKCLHLPANSDGRDLVIQSCNGSPNQTWDFNDHIHLQVWLGEKTLELKHSLGKCLDIEFGAGGINNGAPAQVWGCTVGGRDNQTFRIVRASGRFVRKWHRAVKDSNMCFSFSSCSRKTQLDEIRSQLFTSENENQREFGLTNHTAIGRGLLTLGGRTDLSRTEKVYIWNKQAWGQNALHFGSHPLVRNQGPSTVLTTYKHTIVAFDEGYHGPMVDLPLEEALETIRDHENPNALTGFIVNQGDISASYRTVIAMKRFKKTNNFGEFARYWNSLMRNNYWDDWCTTRIWHTNNQDCSWVEESVI